MRSRLLIAGAVITALLGGAAGPATGASTPLAPRENVEYVTGSNNSTGGHVVIEGNRLYVGAYGLGMRIFDISEPAAPRQIGSYMPGVRADAVPDAAIFDGRHIAVLNGTRRVQGHESIRTDRSEFLDVTDASNPKVLWTFVGPDDGEAHNGDIFDSRRWWLPSGGTGDNGLRIYSLQPLLGETPAAPARLWPPDGCRAEADVKCDPVTLWESSPHRRGRPVGGAFTHTHDMTIYENYPLMTRNGPARRDIVLLAEGGRYLDDEGNTGSVFVIDITDPTRPVVLLRWLHERGPDHHPIRYHHEAQFLDGNRHVMLVTDEDLHAGAGCSRPAGGVVAVRLSRDLTSAKELSEWFIPTGTPAPMCSVHVFSSKGNLAFFGSYNAGLQVVDYSKPNDPRRVGYYVAEGTTAWGALVHKKGIVYVGDMTRGLDVYRYTGPRFAER